MLVAKATFRVGEGGRVQLDTQDPVPFYDGDELTEVGIRPRDDLPRHDPAFEVLLLGAAYGSNGQAVAERRVSLTVGTERRELLVTGDRHWIGRESISAPVPFVRMPMTVDRTFGGSCEVLVDDGAIMTVVHPPNRHGRGFDPEPAARALGEWLRLGGLSAVEPRAAAPEPRTPAAAGRGGYDDAPDPACWSALPMDTLLHLQRGVVMPSGNPPTPDDAQVGSMLGTSWMKDGFFHRAHPDWVIDLPPAAATIEIDGVRPHGPIRFALPSSRWRPTSRSATSPESDPAAADARPAAGGGTLLPRVSSNLSTGPHSGIECSFRLRLENAWRTGQ